MHREGLPFVTRWGTCGDVTTPFSVAPLVCPVTGMPVTLRMGGIKVLVDDALPENKYIQASPTMLIVARNIYSALQREIEAEKPEEPPRE